MSGRAEWGRVYLADITPLYQEALRQRAYAVLDETRRRKADACQMPGAKAASLAAGLLAQHALRENGYSGWTIVYGNAGQPLAQKEQRPLTQKEGELLAQKEQRSLMQKEGQPLTQKEKTPLSAMPTADAPYISLSHSGDYAVCAISNRPVGVDIQKIQPIRRGMLRHFFTEEEADVFCRRHRLGACESGYGSGTDGAAAFAENGVDSFSRKSADFLPEEAAQDFLRLWTVKESYMKLVGAGLSLGLSNVAVDMERRMVWQKHPAPAGGTGAGQECGFQELKAPDGYFLTACVRERKTNYR